MEESIKTETAPVDSKVMLVSNRRHPTRILYGKEYIFIPAQGKTSGLDPSLLPAVLPVGIFKGSC
jgi:hypothetical protein